MKKIIYLCVWVILCAACTTINSWFSSQEEPPPPPLSQNEKEKILEVSESKKRILVLDFINRSDYGGTDLGHKASDKVRTFVSDFSSFVLVRPTEVSFQSTVLDANGNYDLYKIYQKAKENDAQGVILGEILSLDFKEWGDEVGLFRSRYYTVNAKLSYELIDVETERKIISKTEDVELVEEHTKVLDEREPQNIPMQRAELAVEKSVTQFLKLLPPITKQIAWRGKIANISPPRLFINAGEKTGLRPGHFLNVYAKGTPVQDSSTGDVLGVAPGRFKGTLRVIEMMGDDGAVAIIHSGGGFLKDDRVQLHKENAFPSSSTNSPSAPRLIDPLQKDPYDAG